jgi:hypothetical protein
MNAIIFARKYLDHDIIITQRSMQFLQSKADLCKCDHLEFHRVDEEGHGVCRYCSCDQFDLQLCSFLYSTIIYYCMEASKKLYNPYQVPSSSLSRMEYVRPFTPGFLTSSLLLIHSGAFSNRSVEDSH